MNQLGVFAKYWQPGEVKTRLAAKIGQQPASEIYREFVAILLNRLGGVVDRCMLIYSPPSRREDFAKLAESAGDGWQLAEQAEGDLGERMRDYFADALAGPAERVVLIGSDSPTLPLESLQEAFQLLKTHRVVLGPTDDGGYWLVGASGTVPPIFDNIAWSTHQVLPQTRQRLEQSGLPFAILPPWYDADDVDDLRRLREELVGQAEQDSSWQPLQRMVEAACDSLIV